MTTLSGVWEMFEAHFADAFPGATCAHFAVTFKTADGEQATVGATREGFSDWMKEFDDEPDDAFSMHVDEDSPDLGPTRRDGGM